MLRQISKNVDPYFFEQLIGDLTENIPVDTMPASNGRQTGRIYPTPNSRKIEVSFMKDKHGVWRTWSTFQPKTTISCTISREIFIFTNQISQKKIT